MLSRIFHILIKFTAIAAVFLFLLFPGSDDRGFAQENDSIKGEAYPVKAGFIYNFAKFTIWPGNTFPETSEVFLICLAGNNPEAAALFALEKKPLRKKTISVKKWDPETDLDRCRILFFATDNRKTIKKTLERIRTRNILTVGEIDGFEEMGGIVNFFFMKNRLRFRINVDALFRTELRMRSHMFTIAEIYHEKQREQEQTPKQKPGFPDLFKKWGK